MVPLLYVGVAHTEIILGLASTAIVGLSVSATNIYHEVVVEEPLKHEIRLLRQEASDLRGYKTKSGGYVYIRGSAEDVSNMIMRDKFGDKFMVGE